MLTATVENRVSGVQRGGSLEGDGSKDAVRGLHAIQAFGEELYRRLRKAGCSPEQERRFQKADGVDTTNETTSASVSRTLRGAVAALVERSD